MRPTSRPSPARCRRYLWVLGGVVLLALAGLGVFNAMVDPFDVYQLAFREKLLEYKDGWYTRTAKGEMLAHGGWATVVVGNSRVELGIAPASGQLEQPAYNAGLPGASSEELMLAAKLAMQAPYPAQLKRIVLCIHLRDFLQPRNEEEYKATRLNPDLSLLDYHLGNLIGLEATGKSLATLGNARKHKTGRAYKLGLVEHPDAATSPRAWQLRDYGTMAASDDVARTGELSVDRVRQLRDVLAMAARRQVRVDLVILPTHAVATARLQLNGQWPSLEQFVSEVTNLVAVHHATFPSHQVAFWDFTSFEGACAEAYPTREQPKAEMKWWYDSGHFRPALGEAVLGCINGTGDQSIGVRLKVEYVQVHLNRLRAGRDAFLAGRE